MKGLTTENLNTRPQEAVGEVFETKLRQAVFQTFATEIKTGRTIHPGDLNRLLARKFSLTREESRQLALVIGLHRNCRGYRRKNDE